MSAWNNFLESIREAKAELGIDKGAWYLGQPNEKYHLVPPLLRYEDGEKKEFAVFEDVERSAIQFAKENFTDWDLLIDMQHYGVPTRLLDWTDVLGVAVAFALIGNDSDTVPAVYVLNPHKLNEKSRIQDGSGSGVIPRISRNSGGEVGLKYKEGYLHGGQAMNYCPVAVDCVLRNSRLAAQIGNFTIHGIDKEPFEGCCSDCIVKVPLPNEAKAGAYEFLEFANLNPYSLFTDHVGLAQHIRRKHFGQNI